ncbi:MAG: flagellar biosynthesis protein FlhF [Pseudomonadota bacterium]
MKIMRHRAATSREALEKVKREQGPDAVILNNEQTEDGGVEVVAATDYDAALLHQQFGPAPTTDAAPEVTGASASAARADAGVNRLESEMHSLRHVVFEQLAELTSSELAHRHPARAGLMRSLERLGLAQDLIRELATTQAQDADPDSVWRTAISEFANRIPLLPTDPCAVGGIFAFIGPTGVGKTSTIGKLAARHAIEHGHDSVALINCDHLRIGAHTQLERMGALLNIPVQPIRTINELGSTLSCLAAKRLVLIDTPGFAPRDPALFDFLHELQSSHERLRALITLAANASRASQLDALRQFQAQTTAALVLTKIDEATSLGPALSAAISTNRPIAYTCEGQRVPEDIRSAHDHRAGLVGKAVTLMHEFGADSSSSYPTSQAQETIHDS